MPDEELAGSMRTIGYMLAGEDWQTAPLLLDSPQLDTPEIDAMLAARAKAASAEIPAEPQPSPMPPTPRVFPNAEAHSTHQPLGTGRRHKKTWGG